MIIPTAPAGLQIRRLGAGNLMHFAHFWPGLQIQAEQGGGYWDSLFFAIPLSSLEETVQEVYL